MYEFKKENGLAIAKSETGLNIIAVACGEKCGCSDDNPICTDDAVTILTTLVDCDENGNPTTSKKLGGDYKIHIPVIEEVVEEPIEEAAE